MFLKILLNYFEPVAEARGGRAGPCKENFLSPFLGPHLIHISIKQTFLK